MIRTLIVDDEPDSLENLQLKITEFCPELTLVSAFTDPGEALAYMQTYPIDLLFLDIEMPRMNGFHLLNELGTCEFEIIFTTAYNHYAVEAIRLSAFDYLMKPISIMDLQSAIQRLVLTSGRPAAPRMEALNKNLITIYNQSDKISVATSEGLEFIVISHIVRIEASTNYSRIFFREGRSVLYTRQLKDFEEMLSPYRFFRIHHSHLINLNYIKKYIRGEGGKVIMENGDELDIARRKREEFLKIISQ